MPLSRCRSWAHVLASAVASCTELVVTLCLPSTAAEEDTFSDLDDGELDGFLLSREEAQLKEQVQRFRWI